LEKSISAANAPKNEWTKGRIKPRVRGTEQADKVIVTPLEPEKTSIHLTGEARGRKSTAGDFDVVVALGSGKPLF
jgi:hypothetical protein